MDKTLPDLATAVAGISDGMTVMIGGFGGSGAPSPFDSDLDDDVPF